LAFIHYILGEYNAAQSLFKENLLLAEIPENRLLLLRNLAKTMEALNNNREADSLFKLALKESIFRLGKNHQETSVSYQALGEYNLRHKKYDEAIAMFQLALDILVNNYSVQKSTINYVKVLMAKALTLKSNFSEAEKIFLEATSGFDPGNAQSFMEADVRIKEAFFGLAGLYYLLSKGKEDTLMLEKSLSNYLTGLMIVEKLGMNIADESRLIMNQDHRRRMSEALAVCYELFVATGNTDYIDQAFELSSKAKAAVLLSSIRHNKALEFGGVPSEVTYRENALREEISVVRKLMYTERLRKVPSEAQLGYLENKLFLLDKQYDSLIEHIGHQYPAYFRLKYQNNLMQLSEVQQELNEDQVLLDYVFHDSISFLIAATRHEKRFIKLIESQNAGTMVKELLEHLKPDFSTLSRADYDRYIDLSHELYRHLVWPVEDMIQEKQLVVIPDGVLGYIPFEVLLTKLPDSTERMDYAMLSYLVKSNSLSYVYSATLRYLDKEVTETSDKGKVLSFVPDYSVSHDFFAEADLEGDNRSRQLVPLPYARTESMHVLSMVEGRELLGAKASKANFISIANDYEVLHLAMHTQINDNNPLYSRLIFHPASDSLDAFTLSTYELYNLRLNANLVVLSACNTGSGSLQQGEGIMSLSRGFIYAGVPSIVMTTWEVHDESGSRLMERFYYYLREGLGKDEAMRQSKLDFLAESNRLKAHPYFWSSYVLIGNPEPIFLEPRGSSWLRTVLFILALVFFVSVSAYFLLKKRRLPAPDGSRQYE
jgi:CHAT domain-containing protein/tetratricopeptide (TPR) repeat protein